MCTKWKVQREGALGGSFAVLPWGCINPPITPNGPIISLFFVTIPGMIVWYGRLLGA